MMAKVLRTEWYEETVKALQINGKGERTQQAYAYAFQRTRLSPHSMATHMIS